MELGIKVWKISFSVKFKWVFSITSYSSTKDLGPLDTFWGNTNCSNHLILFLPISSCFRGYQLKLSLVICSSMPVNITSPRLLVSLNIIDHAVNFKQIPCLLALMSISKSLLSVYVGISFVLLKSRLDLNLRFQHSRPCSKLFLTSQYRIWTGRPILNSCLPLSSG
jgi:hypothetical protein